jgi:thiosulfate sulfurtransferase
MSDFTCISVQEAHEMMSSGKVTIVDVRAADAFAQAHIAKAKLINDENIEIFLKEADKESPLICYCYHGFSSQRASLFIFSLSSTACLAKKDNMEAKLKQEFGDNLTKAPFFLRFSFEKSFNKDWKDSNYSERHEFLENYELESAADEAQEKAEDKAAQDAKKEELKKEKDRLKAELAEEKAAEKEEADRLKAFDKAMKN